MWYNLTADFSNCSTTIGLLRVRVDWQAYYEEIWFGLQHVFIEFILWIKIAK